MKEERYLNISLSPNDINSNILSKLKQKYLYREIDNKMITDIHINRSDNIEIYIQANVTYKTYKKGDIIYGELYINDNYKDDRVFVMSHDIICEILNTNILPKIKSKNQVKVRLTNIKSTNGCIYFLSQGEIILQYLL